MEWLERGPACAVVDEVQPCAGEEKTKINLHLMLLPHLAEKNYQLQLRTHRVSYDDTITVISFIMRSDIEVSPCQYDLKSRLKADST